MISRATYPEEIEWLHAYLLEKFEGYDIFCTCEGYLYHASVRSFGCGCRDKHSTNGPFIFIAERPTDTAITLHGPGEYERTYLYWHDPEMISKLTSHIENRLKQFQIKRHTATI